MFWGLSFMCLVAGLPFPDQPDIWLDMTRGPGDRPIYFIAPHENENVINEYVRGTVRVRGGTLIILKQAGERHIRFDLDGKSWEIDPNRIFTPLGAKNSLLFVNSNLSEQHPKFAKLHERAVRLGQFILAQCTNLGSKASVIALHNNTDGYDGDGKDGIGTISIQRYLRKMEAGAAYIQAVHAGDGDEDDLFFITEPEDYQRMKQAGWHVILQHPQVAVLPDQDDGSLSVLAEKQGWRYINIEAQRKPPADHFRVQARMVDFVMDLISDDKEPAAQSK